MRKNARGKPVIFFVARQSWLALTYTSTVDLRTILVQTVLTMDLAPIAAKNVRNIVYQAVKYDDARKALIVYDRRCPLTSMLTDGYMAALPNAATIDFDASTPEQIIAEIDKLSAGDLVVMVQSTNFLLVAFRFRIELFQRGMAVIEHMHLERITDPTQQEVYVQSIAFDTTYYNHYGLALKPIIDACKTVVVRCHGGTTLTYEGGMEPAKLNIGNYEGMKNVGGTFPIGEVFSEPTDLAKVNGEAMLYAFARTNHLVSLYEPFKIVIKEGVLVSHEGPKDFQDVLDLISLDEKILVREFGLGLNPHMGKTRVVDDITAFERQLGLHFSLGEKHGIYKKPGFNPKKTRYHIDVFVDVQSIDVDGRVIYLDGKYLPELTPPALP